MSNYYIVPIFSPQNQIIGKLTISHDIADQLAHNALHLKTGVVLNPTIRIDSTKITLVSLTLGNIAIDEK